MPLNYETKGSELAKQAHDTRNRTTADIIVNEDYSMLVKVVVYFEGIVTAQKVWDEAASPKLFEAVAMYRGKEGYPEDHEIKEGEYVVFHRVGEFENAGFDGFELHEADKNKTSWVCFADKNEACWVLDTGSGSGTKVKYENSTWIAVGDTLPLVATDPLVNFYNSSPPWKAGRVYLAQRYGSAYVVDLMGFGPEEKIFSQTAGEITFTLKTDSTGKVLGFTAE